jgi:hypothetical protein
MRVLWVGVYGPDINLLTAPKNGMSPSGWLDTQLASVRGELNYHLMNPRLQASGIEKAEKLRSEIEIEMRKRLGNHKQAEVEFRRRCLFHESKPNYES